ncbi:MAG: ABC transporter permease [Chthoniobacter sp.]|nr:ABC transporter permease [Chthoniobacter sp.]
MAEVSARPDYEVVIEPSRGWLRIDWRALWEYRDLLVLLVQRDFISRYKQTMLGPLWHFLQPVMNAAVYFVIFGVIAGIPTDGLPPPLFYLCSQLTWNYFAQNVTVGGATFVNNASLFGKVYFPRLLVPVSVIVANLIAVGLQCIPFALCFVWFKFFTPHGATMPVTWMVLLAPLPLLQAALFSLGVSLWMSASTAKYRDLVHLNQYLIQIWMFATPVVWPLSKVPAQWKWIALANPMAVPVEGLRICLLGHGTLGATEVAVSIGLTLLVLVTGIAVFQKVERTVIDSV